MPAAPPGGARGRRGAWDGAPINHTHGHAVGDQVLCEVARRLQLALRSSDAAPQG